jgi:ADP-heptose:LPS heptosyltransferase
MPSRRVLVIAEGQLGDLLLLTPAVRAIKSSLPGSFLAVLVVQRRGYGTPGKAVPAVLNVQPGPGTSEVLLLNPYVDAVVEVDRSSLRSLKGKARLAAELSVIRWIRKGAFDTVICTFPEDRFAVWASLSGAGMRVGQNDQSLRWMLTHAPDIRKDQGGVLHYYCDLVVAAGAVAGSTRTEFPVPEASRARAQSLLRARGFDPARPLVIVHPGASGAHRVWPPERFAGVIGELRERTGAWIVLCGTAFDQQVVRAVREEVRTEVDVWTLGESVADFAGLLSLAALCVSNDSGPRHLAVAVGTPSIALMPKHNDKAWKIYADDPRTSTFTTASACPACPPDRCRDVVPEGETFGSCCLRMISMDDVITRALEILALTPRP